MEYEKIPFGKIALWFIAFLVFLFAIDFVGNTYGLFSYGLFAPKKENIRRKVFEQTQSYVQGKIQDLSNYKYQLDTTKDEASKAAIKAVIRTQFANFRTEDCPDELKAFLQSVRGF